MCSEWLRFEHRLCSRRTIYWLYKVYIGATLVNAHRYSDISKNFENKFPKHLPYCVGPLLLTFAARIRTNLGIQPYLGQGRPPSLLPNCELELNHSSIQLPIYLVAGRYMVCYRLLKFLLFIFLIINSCLICVALRNSARSILKHSSN